MAREIERKFRIRSEGWRALATSSRRFRQGYLAATGRAAVRIRIDGAEKAKLTVKSAVPGPTRDEFEYSLPVADAEAMLALCEGGIIEKVRHLVPAGSHTWEIDVFEGDNAGLVIAEIELESNAAAFARPDWLGEEVTDDPRYYNARLASQPFKDWGSTQR